VTPPPREALSMLSRAHWNVRSCVAAAPGGRPRLRGTPAHLPGVRGGSSPPRQPFLLWAAALGAGSHVGRPAGSCAWCCAYGCCSAGMSIHITPELNCHVVARNGTFPDSGRATSGHAQPHQAAIELWRQLSGASSHDCMHAPAASHSRVGASAEPQTWSPDLPLPWP
jgi:hypothetical protein